VTTLNNPSSPGDRSDTARRSNPRHFAAWVYAAFNVPLVFAIYSFPQYHTYLWGLLGLGSAAAVVVGTIRNRPTHPIAWLVVGVGVMTFALGDITYDVLTKYMHELNPYPSLADVFYLATYLLLASGLILMVRSRRRRGGDAGAGLDAFIVTSGLGALSWIYLIEPYVHAIDMTMLQKITSIAYPLGDILLLCVLIRLVFGGGTRSMSVRLLVLGAVGVLGADCFYGWIQLHGSWKVGGPTDLGWVLFYVCWGTAALHPSMRDLTLERPWRPRHLSSATLVFLSASALVAPIALVLRDFYDVPTDGGVLAAVSALTITLVVVRLVGLARVQATDARREQTLRSFSEFLVVATDRASVWSAGVKAVLDIEAVGVVGCIVTASDSRRVEIVAATWPAMVGRLVNVTSISARNDERTVVLVSGDAVGDVSETTVWTQLVSSDLQDLHERILVAHDRPLPVDLRAILDGIVAQLCLALERVELAHVVNEAKNERRFRSMIQYSSDLITLLGTDLRVVYQSPSVKKILGRMPEEFRGMSLQELVHPDDVLTAQSQLTKVMTGGLGSTSAFEFRLENSDGEWRIVDGVVTNLLDEPDVGAIVLNGRDVTERRGLEQELNHLALHDTLTGLANRSLFFDRLSHAMDRRSRDHNQVAVLFLDLDDFKTVNDSFGHPAGDHLLVEVAKRLRTAIRPGDTVARFGGDEFAVLVEAGPMPETAQEVAGRIIEAVVPTFRVFNNDVTMRASVGIAITEHLQDSPDDLLRDADLAMYVAKRNGKGRYEMYQPKMHEDALRRLETEVGIRDGLDSNEFEVFYQPLVNAHTGQLVAAEALVRWNHPKRGLLTPIDFISVAEATGLIVPLGEQVLLTAVAQTQEWRQSGVVDDDFYISVNLSAHQLQEADLVDVVARALEDTGLPPESLVLEVTETALIEDFDITVPRLLALRALGVRLAIDDFGTGYSSLSYLADLPINFVKIDKSFIDRMTPDAEGSAVVRGVIDLSQAMGFACVAEGVEQEAQRSILDELGCDYIQGFLFSRPKSSTDILVDFTKLRLGDNDPVPLVSVALA